MSSYKRINELRDALNRRILGQRTLIDRLIITLLANGHILVEGPPGLAKTTAVKTLSEGIDTDYHRIQFTPDLLPADLIGTEIYRHQEGSFSFQQGPLFHSILLADEVNRAPAKVQSALLEAMAERQITVGRTTYALPELFMVMATQNPIEQQGTYNLPEAQLDRFLLHTRVDYPDAHTEAQILSIERQRDTSNQVKRPLLLDPLLTLNEIFGARREVQSVYLAPNVEHYLIELIMTTRDPIKYSDQLAQWIALGASPRGTIALERSAKAFAWLNGKDFVTPGDIQTIAPDVLRHRIMPTFTAQGLGISTDTIIDELLKQVPVP